MKKTLGKVFKSIISITLVFTVFTGINSVFAEDGQELPVVETTAEAEPQAIEETPAEEPAEVTPTEEAPVVEETPVVEEAPAVEETPVMEEAPVSEPMPMSIGDTYTVVFYDWDNTVLATQTIDEGDSAVSPAIPTREGYKFVGWDKSLDNITSDTSFVAQYAELTIYTYTIYYVYEVNGVETTATQPYVATFEEGGNADIDRTSPTFPGYIADQPTVSIHDTNITSNKDVYVKYTPATNTTYTEETYKQNIDGTYNATADETFTSTASTGASVTAQDRNYVGFTPASLPTATINASGTTVIKVYYERNEYELDFVTYGSPIDAQVIAYEKTPSAVADPTRTGYTFNGWFADAACTQPVTLSTFQMPAADATLYAGWQGQQVSYMYRYWLQNPDDDNYTYQGTTNRDNNPEGIAGEAVVLDSSKDVTTVTWSIATDKFDYNQTKTETENAGKTIAGDGSTIVDIYFDRIILHQTVQFKDGSGEWLDGVTYPAQSNLQIELRYGQHFSLPTLTPTDSSKTHEFYVTSAPGSNMGLSPDTTYPATESYLFTLDNGILYAYYASTTHLVIYNSYAECLNRTDEGCEYNAEHDKYYFLKKTEEFNWDATDNIRYGGGVGFVPAEPDPVSGLGSAVGVWNEEHTIQTYNSYINRRYFNLSYYSNGQIIKPLDQVAFEADLTKYNPAEEDYIGTGPAGYVLKGWYDTESPIDGIDQEYDLSNTTMPAKNLILYAVWEPVSYSVKLTDSLGILTFPEQNIYVNEKATRPADTMMVADGYTFKGWYVKNPDGTLSNNKFSFETPITGDLEVEAVWEPKTNLSYTVKYLYPDGTEAAPSTTGTGTMGEVITVNAAGVSGYLPDEASKSLSITNVEANNVITFTYDQYSSIGYTVYYQDEDGNDLCDPENGRVVTPDVSATVRNTKSFPGYTPTSYQETITLSKNEALNVIVFTFTKNEDVNYTVNHDIQGSVSGYITYLSETFAAAAGSMATYTPIEIVGYIYSAVTSKLNVPVASDGSSVLTLRYLIKNNSVTFNAGANGSLVGTTSYTVPNYQLWGNAGITIPTPVANSGYHFAGWNIAFPSNSDKVVGNMVFIALFELDNTPTPPPGRTCQDDGYPAGYYWNGTACVIDPTPVPPTPVPPTPNPVTPTPTTPEPEVSATPEYENTQVTTPSIDVNVVNNQGSDTVKPEYGATNNSWALINLIAALASLVLAIALIASKSKKEEDEEDSELVRYDENGDAIPNTFIRHKAYKVLLGIVAAASIIVFVLTEDLTAKMQLVDKWTLLMVVLAIVSIVGFIIGRKWKEEDEEATNN